MKKSVFVIVILTVALLLSACNVQISSVDSNVITGSGKVVTQDVAVSGFDRVLMASIGELTITQGETESLRIEAEDNILPVLESTVSNGQLTLSVQSNAAINSRKGIHYTLVVKDLSELELAGMGDVTFDGLTTGSLKLNLSGSGDLKLTGVQAADVRVTLNGMGSVVLSGQADSLDLNVKGSGDIDAGELAVKDARISIAGMGSATVWAADTLNAEISGSGNLKYYGEPAVSQEISGMGDIESLGKK